jgi:hypothetical protein
MARIKIQDLSEDAKPNKQEMRAVYGGLTSFQGIVISALNCLDQSNMDLLNQIINAANEVSNSGDTGNITFGSATFGQKSLAKKNLSDD